MRRWLVIGAIAIAQSAFAAEAPPCPHPYFPMAEGTTFTYRAGKSEVTVRFSEVAKKDGETRATLRMHHKGKDGSTVATCSTDGIKTELGGFEGAALSMSGMDVKVLDSQGVAMPPPSELQQGKSWVNTMAIEMRPPSGSKLAFGVVKSTFKKESTVEGAEKIKVAGKTWDALRVRNKITAMAGTSGERSMENLMWIAPGAGVLRIQTGDTIDFELLKIEKNTASARGVGGAGSSRGQGASH